MRWFSVAPRVGLVLVAMTLSLMLTLPVSFIVHAQGGPENVDGRIIADPDRNPCQNCVPVQDNFTYQGVLKRGGSPYTGQCDFLFSLYASATASQALNDPNKAAFVLPVENGLFTVNLDPTNGAFKGQGRWLGIQVRCGGEAQYTQLSPRQRLWAVPFAQSLPGFWTQETNYSPNIIGGSHANRVGQTAIGATISGGGTENDPNEVLAEYGTVAGGRGNAVNTNHATVSGGVRNTADGEGATISGGGQNIASGEATSITGGAGNIAIGLGSSILGGHVNTANGEYSAILGGEFNTATGDYSLAAGRNASANQNGSMVFADSRDFDFNSTAANEFSVRATGGVRFVSSINGTTGAPTAGVRLAPGAGAWSNLSDRQAKTNVATVNSVAILRRLLAVPITTWNYTAQGDGTRHMGPMAQDFYAAFGLGEDNRYISTGDIDGVALAAIQGLYHEVQTRDAAINQLQSENQTLKANLSALEQRVAAIETATGLTPAPTAPWGQAGWWIVVGMVGAAWVMRRAR